MPQWIVTLFGEDLASIVWVVIVAAIVCLLAVVLITIARKAFGGGTPAAFRSRAPRLAVIDMVRVDEKRRLVLLRRDEVEHLVLLGGQTDIVVEPNILRLPAASGGRVEPSAEGLLANVPSRSPILAARTPPAERHAEAPGAGDAAFPDATGLAPLAERAMAAPPHADPAVSKTQQRGEERTTVREPGALDPGNRPPKLDTPGERPATDGSDSGLAARLGAPVQTAAAALAAAMPAALRPRAPETSESIGEMPRRSLATPTLPPQEPREEPVRTSSKGERGEQGERAEERDRELRASREQQAPVESRPFETTRTAAGNVAQNPQNTPSRTDLRARMNESQSPLAKSVEELTTPAQARRSDATRADVSEDRGPEGERIAVRHEGAAKTPATVADSRREPLSVRSFATAIQNRKAPPVMPAPAIPAAAPTVQPSRTDGSDPQANVFGRPPAGAGAASIASPGRSGDRPESAASAGPGASSSRSPAGEPTGVRKPADEDAQRSKAVAPAESADGRSGMSLAAASDEPTFARRQGASLEKNGSGDRKADDDNLDAFLSTVLEESFADDTTDRGVPDETDRPKSAVEASAQPAKGDIAPKRVSSDWSAPPAAGERGRDASDAGPATSKPRPGSDGTGVNRPEKRPDEAISGQMELPPEAATPASSTAAPPVGLAGTARLDAGGPAPSVDTREDDRRNEAAPRIDAPVREPAGTSNAEGRTGTGRAQTTTPALPTAAAPKRPDDGTTKASPTPLAEKTRTDHASRRLTLEDEMERLLGDFSFDETDRPTR